MRLNQLMVPALFALVGFVPAQAYNIRGEVRMNETNSAYYLHCTDWTVKFSAAVPDTWAGKQLLMKAVNVGTPGDPYLDVQKVALTDKTFHLGEMKRGDKAEGTVIAPLGSYVSVCLDTPSNVGWGAYPGIGVWILGPDPCGFADGFVYDNSDRTKGFGEFKFQYMVPRIDNLIGQTFTGQAMVYGPMGLFFSNPDCQTVK